MLPTLDRSRLPLVVVGFPSAITAAELDAHLDEIDALALTAPGGRIALVVDLRQANLLTLELREHLAARMRAGYPRIAGRVAGVAHVVASPLTLAAMRTLWWVAPPPFATLVTRSLEQATAWSLARATPQHGADVRATRPAS